MIILQGLSGTGKSSLPRYFAKFIGSRPNFNPVQTTWRDKTSIISYFNDFTQTFNETEFLKQMYRATYEVDRLNIMVVMNLILHGLNTIFRVSLRFRISRK